MGWGYDHNYYPPAKPRKARGGIKAQSKRGAFAQSWWAKRWVGVLESFDIGARLHRGRSYARRGQVVSVDIQKGVVTAQVQGTRALPYDVAIKVEPLSKADWKKLANTLSRQALFAAKLLAGEMPENIEEAFKDAGLSLFPTKHTNLMTNCSCPDWSNPCKHIAAVYYLLGEEFDRDPFLIFKLRGMDREEMIALVAGRTTGKGSKGNNKEVSSPEPTGEAKPSPPPEPLTADPATFWGREIAEEESWSEVLIPMVPAALPKRAGSFPFWRGEKRFLAAMEDIYREASPVGLDVFLGQGKAEGNR